MNADRHGRRAMHWRSKPILELADLPPEEQTRLWKQATRLRLTDIPMLVAVLATLAVGSAAMVLLIGRDGPLWTKHWWVDLPITGLIFWAMGAVTNAITHRHYRAIVRRLR